MEDHASRDLETRGEQDLRHSRWRAMWEFTRLPAIARFSILIVSVLALSATAVIEFVSDESSVTGYLEVAILAAIALFAWRAPIASLAVLAVVGVAVGVGLGPPYVLALALMYGLVVYTCSTWLIVVYAVAGLILSVIVAVTAQQASPGGTLATLAFLLASGIVGLAFRRNQRRVVDLNADLEKATQEAAQVVKVERDRIADELHNIIAHDLTIVVMHSRALRLVDESADRKLSEEAIMRAATQAMTDIRRMLQVVNDEWDSETRVPTQVQSLLDRLPVLKRELESAGVTVEMSIPQALPVSHSVDATLGHLASESVTNIMKHSPGCASARIELVISDSSVTLRVWNAPGRGEPVAGLSSGYGLKRMAERVELLGGSLTTGKRDGGWQLEAVLPLI